jgi:hypothetical protein
VPASARKQAEVGERRERTLALRAAGATTPQTAAELDVPATTVRKDLERVLAGKANELLSGEHALVLELDRLDRAERATQLILRQAAAAGAHYDPRTALRAVDRLLMVSDRRRRLLRMDKRLAGSDAPQPAPGFTDEIADRRKRRRAAQGW